jgi:hypothetical protein
METLPFYLPILFILSTFFAVGLLFKAARYSKPLILLLLLWLALQMVAGLSGFYTVTKGMPPRFLLLIAPPVLLIVMMFITKAGRRFIDGFDVKTLTLLHIVRIPVELTLYGLFLHKVVPQIMTFEGHNFDILCGLTAPFIYYFGYVKKQWGHKVLIAWNVACLLLLTNIVVTAVLSAPFAFQQFAFEQPNIVLFYFPYLWLPGCIVPIALWAHLVSLRRLYLEAAQGK